MSPLLKRNCNYCGKQYKKKHYNHNYCCAKCRTRDKVKLLSHVGEGGEKFKKARADDFNRQSQEEQFNSMMIFVKDVLRQEDEAKTI
jgi:hypothetical protein